MKALVLDFDGVISDSAGEALAVGLRTYLELEPASSLRSAERETLLQAFVEAMPLGNRAEDFGTVLAALEERQALPDQAAYDRFRDARDPAWLAEYHRRFYEVRHRLQREDLAGWRALSRPYRPLLQLLRRRAGSVAYAIATAKDRSSVDTLLADYGAADLFPGEWILDKQQGVHKTSHLRRLRELLEVEFSEMTFVDDKVNHLDAVAGLGVRCALAAWGYNGPREHRLAAERGYLVLTLNQADQLF